MLPASWYEPALLTSTSSAPPGGDGGGDAVARRILVGDVEVDAVGPAILLAQRAATRSALVVDVGDEHVGAGRGEHAGDRLADPGRRPGHEGDLAVEGEQPGDRLVHGRSVPAYGRP